MPRRRCRPRSTTVVRSSGPKSANESGSPSRAGRDLPPDRPRTHARVRARGPVARRGARRGARARRRGQPAGVGVLLALRRAGPGERRGIARAVGARRAARRPRRYPLQRQGQPRRRRRPDVPRLGDAARRGDRHGDACPRARVRRPGRRPVREVDDGRDRLVLGELQRTLWAGAQPVEPGEEHERLELRRRGGDGRAPRAAASAPTAEALCARRPRAAAASR